VPVDDATHYSQADAGAFKFILSMQPLKHAEQLVCVLWVKADAIIADKDSDL